jgi:hypothetical protein
MACSTCTKAINVLNTTLEAKDGFNPWEINHLEQLGVDGRTILKWVFKKPDERRERN